MTASIGDVAATANVSVATVSRALRGLPNVAPSTRERVLNAAAELNYVADPNASRLAAGQTRSVGIVVPLFTQWFFSQVVAGIEGVLSANGYDLSLYSAAGDALDRFVADPPFRKRVDGLVMIEMPLEHRHVEQLQELELPVVQVGMHTDAFAAAAATRHLTNLGHTDIGLIAGLPDNPLRTSTPIERRQGYRQALEEAGIEVRPELDVPGNFSPAGGTEAMAQLLATSSPPTGVFAESDEMAIGALKTVRDLGLRVPEDVSVIGFDDHELAEFTGLTTMAQPVLEQGEGAARMLLDHIEDPEAKPEDTVMQTRLRIRTTTGPARAETPRVE